MAVFVHYYALVGAYLVCGCDTPDDFPCSMFQGGRELENFIMGWTKYNEMEDIMKFLERVINKDVGWEIYE